MKGNVVKDCNNSNAHTRISGCVMFEGRPSGLIFTKPESSFSLDKDTFETELKAAVYNPPVVRITPETKLNPPVARITPLMYGISNFAVSGGDLATSQEGWGGTKFTGLNEVREDYTITEGGYCLYKQLYKLHGLTMRVFKIDNALTAFGTVKNVAGVDKFFGYKVTIGVVRRISTGDQQGAITLSLVYSADFENDDVNAHAIQLSEKVEGLSGIQLQKTGSGKAKVVTACTGSDLTDIYGADLAEPALYKNRAGGNPTSVAYASGELTFTPAAAYKIVEAADLKAEGIEGYEGEEEYIDIS